MKRRFPELVYNPVSLTGASIAALSAGLILFLSIVEFFAREHKPYIGIITFIILPAILFAGLLLIAYGIYREYKLRKKGLTRVRQLPAIDLNDPKQFRAFLVFSVGTIVFLLASAFGSFKAYEYTDSDEFCGTICHTVMEPEYTAYLNSPHSKVGCVKCHIGPGADWFVRAKISGSYQLYSVMFNKFSRPIPTPIENLRPAQETCEQCHSPKHFYGQKKITLYHFLSDEDNTRSSLSMLLKIGGGNSESGLTSGIHWHMNSNNEVWYYPSDNSRQKIPYIKQISKSNDRVTEYFAEGLKPGSIDQSRLRKMDCIDCHNRPSHIYNQPDKIINMNLTNGVIDSTLPYIKSVAIQALEEKYSTKQEAMFGIERFITDFYSGNYTDLVRTKKNSINNSIAAIKGIYQRNYFPEMNVNWSKFPNNIGHTYYDGCFRCHDDKHISPQGQKISMDCNNCHTIYEQTSPETGQQVSLKGLEYNHPGGLNNNIKNQKCSDCHGKPK